MSAPKLTLESPRLLLRPFQEGDLDILHSLYGCHEVMEIRHIGPQTLEGSRQQLASIIASWAEKDLGLMAVFEKVSGAFVGECGLRNDPEWPQVDVGYGLLPQYQGKGYATEAAGCTFTWGFEERDLSEIWAITRSYNTASQQVMDKLGMVRLREIPRADRWIYVYSMTRERWLMKA